MSVICGNESSTNMVRFIVGPHVDL